MSLLRRATLEIRMTNNLFQSDSFILIIDKHLLNKLLNLIRNFQLVSNTIKDLTLLHQYQLLNFPFSTERFFLQQQLKQ